MAAVGELAAEAAASVPSRSREPDGTGIRERQPCCLVVRCFLGDQFLFLGLDLGERLPGSVVLVSVVMICSTSLSVYPHASSWVR